MYPELKSLTCPELEDRSENIDIEDCSLNFEAEIGPSNDIGSDMFFFTVITVKALSKLDHKRWGRGLLIVPNFSMELVNNSLDNLLKHCQGSDWIEIANNLNKELYWEFDNYQE